MRNQHANEDTEGQTFVEEKHSKHEGHTQEEPRKKEKEESKYAPKTPVSDRISFHGIGLFSAERRRLFSLAYRVCESCVCVCDRGRERERDYHATARQLGLASNINWPPHVFNASSADAIRPSDEGNLINEVVGDCKTYAGLKRMWNTMIPKPP